LIIIKYRKIKPRQNHIEILPKSNISDNEKSIPDNENTLEEIIIVELIDQLHLIYQSVPMNLDDSI